MILFRTHLEEALSFIKDNQALADCHLVDFLTGNLWNECLPRDLREQLESVEFDKSGKGAWRDFDKLLETSSELREFRRLADSLTLKNNQSVALLTDESERRDTAEEKRKSQNFMSDKKKHEIEVLARLIGRLVEENETSLVIDAGAGKGYLSTTISERYCIPVLAVDSSKSHQKSAAQRREIMSRKTRKEIPPIQYSIQHLDERTDYEQLVRSSFSDPNIGKKCILTGLHTCGQLAHSMMKNFLRTDSLKSLCVVPCCYHLTEESLTGRCNFTKNARMLAQQSVERTQSRDEEPHPVSLFYRALLQVILLSLGKSDSRIGRGAPTQDFPSYARWALTKIGVDSRDIPSSECLAELHLSHLDSQWKFSIFQWMRIHLGSVLEAAIVLDRVLYLQESDRCTDVALIRLFDPLISPRCYAITASK